jgi:hypothetical protein
MTWVQDGIFAAGGEALPAAWAEFSAQTGIADVLHLRPGAPAAFFGPSPHSFLWLDVATEDQAALSERLLAGGFIDACLREGRKILLHASLGRHRTRWAFVAYQIWTGTAAPTAIRRAACPPWMSPYPTDQDRWQEFAAVARARRSVAEPG